MSPDHDAQHSLVIQHMLACGGGASTDQLTAWGVGRPDIARMLRRGVITRTRRGHFALPWGQPSSDRWQRERSVHLCEVAAEASGNCVAGLRSASLVWGLPVSAVPRRPEILRPPGSGTWSGVRVLRRQLHPDEVTIVNSVPVTTLERTCVDLALDLPTPEALITVDAALRRGAYRALMLQTLRAMGSVRGCREARQTLDWADGHAESALESRGRGGLMLQGVPRPWNNVAFRYEGEEVRPDHWWEGLGIVGEADGASKYDETKTSDQPLWAERLRHGWLEEQLGLRVVRYVDREIRLAPQDVAARWRRQVAWRERQPWEPPPGLEIFQRPLKGSGDPVRWFRRRDEG